MIFSLIATGTVTAAQLFAQGVTTSVVAYSIAKTGNRVRILIWQYIYKILFCIELSPIIQYNINRLVILMLF